MNHATIRRATGADLPRLVELMLWAARHRQTLNPQLWPLAADAPEQIASAIRRDLVQPERAAWLLAEARGAVIGAVQVMVLPAPPVYDLGGGLAGFVTDDFLVRDVPSLEPWDALLAAAEDFMHSQGAVVQTAACPVGWTDKRAALEARGYGPLTLWTVKTDLVASENDLQDVRAATEADLPAIVELGAQAQERKRDADPRFWTPHPDARTRFGGWMRHSLTLPDRDLLVAGQAGGTQGFIVVFIVVQPAIAPPAHDASGVGLIDDFCYEFGAALAGDGPTPLADQLLRAAEHRLIQRGKRQVVAVCPAAWSAKRDLLERHGYRTANLWLIKT